MWGFQQNVLLLINDDLNQTENWKYHMFDLKFKKIKKIRLPTDSPRSHHIWGANKPTCADIRYIMLYSIKTKVADATLGTEVAISL